MKVHFIGAGPGASDLMTLRGAKVLSSVSIVMYAGSLVSRDMLVHCRADAEIVDTASLSLDEQEAVYRRALDGGLDVARLHSGDPAIYGATAEQMRRLDRLGIPYEVVPGVSSFTAAAAVLNAELTKPGVAQTVILTRTGGRASPMPEKESLRALAGHRATLCIFLSGAQLSRVLADLAASYPPETPVALVQKATWPQQRVYEGTLGAMADEIPSGDWQLSTLMLVGPVLDREPAMESKLYSAEYSHRFRKGAAAPPQHPTPNIQGAAPQQHPTSNRLRSDAKARFGNPNSGSEEPETRNPKLETNGGGGEGVKLGVWMVRSEGEAVGRLVAERLGGRLFTPEGVSNRVAFAEAFAGCSHWILIMATGIAVRYLQGLAVDKKSDPAVVVVDEAGRFAVPLLGGHEAGANRLAYQVAEVLGAVPVITTATEALKRLVVGVGCRRGVGVEQIDAAIRGGLARVSREIGEIREVATIDLKAEEPGLRQWCEQHDVPQRIIARSVIAARPWATEPSAWVEENVGVVGVCEPCALVAAFRGQIILPKTALDGVAVAIVEDGR